MFKLSTRIVLVLGTLLVSSVSVFAVLLLTDNFNTLPNKYIDPSAKWYVIQTGNNTQVFDYVADGSSTTLATEGSNTFAKLTISPDSVVGDYQNAELSDVQTGVVYGTTLPWKPEMNKPVVIEADVKWGDNYNLDGTGGAIGSNGIWLWNVPIDYITNTYQPMDAFGLSWATEGSAVLEGLGFNTFKSSIPRSSKKVADVLPNFDMQSWNHVKIVWRQTKLIGEQQILFYLNGTLVDSVILVNPMDTLAVEIWNDNQKYSLTGATLQDATEDQDFFVDNVSVKKF